MATSSNPATTLSPWVAAHVVLPADASSNIRTGLLWPSLDRATRLAEAVLSEGPPGIYAMLGVAPAHSSRYCVMVGCDEADIHILVAAQADAQEALAAYPIPTCTEADMYEHSGSQEGDSSLDDEELVPWDMDAALEAGLALPCGAFDLGVLSELLCARGRLLRGEVGKHYQDRPFSVDCSEWGVLHEQDSPWNSWARGTWGLGNWIRAVLRCRDHCTMGSFAFTGRNDAEQLAAERRHRLACRVSIAAGRYDTRRQRVYFPPPPISQISERRRAEIAAAAAAAGGGAAAAGGGSAGGEGVSDV